MSITRKVARPRPRSCVGAGRTDATVWVAWGRQYGVRHLRHAPRQLAAAQRPAPKGMHGENRPLDQAEPPRGSRGPPAQLLPASLHGGAPVQLLPANLHGGAPRRGEGPALERCSEPARRATHSRHRQLVQKTPVMDGSPPSAVAPRSRQLRFLRFRRTLPTSALHSVDAGRRNPFTTPGDAPSRRESCAAEPEPRESHPGRQAA